MNVNQWALFRALELVELKDMDFAQIARFVLTVTLSDYHKSDIDDLLPSTVALDARRLARNELTPNEVNELLEKYEAL